MNICNFCKKDYSTKYALTKHIKTNKKCLELRNLQKCDICDIFLDSYDLDKHKICEKMKNMEKFYQTKIKDLEISYEEKIRNLEISYEEKIRNLEKEVSKKDKNILKLAEKAISKPTIDNSCHSNTTTIDNSVKMNMMPYESLTDSFINYSFMNSFNENHLLEGQVGVAKFVTECLLSTNDKDGSRKKLMVCTDPSRKIFKTINTDGEVSKDIEAKKLTERIYEPVKTVTNRILKDLNSYYHFLIENTGDDLQENDKEKLQLDIASEKVNKAVEKQIEIINLPKDNSDFSKHLSVSLSV